MAAADKLLAFDTSGPCCAAALLQGDQITVRVDDMPKGQAEHLMPMLQEMLDAAGLSYADLDGIGVGVGPGNFTGIRISVSAARGLALGLNKPAVGISLFDTTQALSNWSQIAVPAPRDQVYFWDKDKTDAPNLVARDALTATAFSTEHAPKDHIACMARLALERIKSGQEIPSPTPLYIKPADAAPSRDTPPVILD